jgi:hypothetical protein
VAGGWSSVGEAVQSGSGAFKDLGLAAHFDASFGQGFGGGLSLERATFGGSLERLDGMLGVTLDGGEGLSSLSLFAAQAPAEGADGDAHG